MNVDDDEAVTDPRLGVLELLGVGVAGAEHGAEVLLAEGDDGVGGEGEAGGRPPPHRRGDLQPGGAVVGAARSGAELGRRGRLPGDDAAAGDDEEEHQEDGDARAPNPATPVPARPPAAVPARHGGPG